MTGTGKRRYTPPSGRHLVLGSPSTPHRVELGGRTLEQNGSRIRRDLVWSASQPGSPTPLMRRYLGWDDFRREEFERALQVVSSMAERQYELLIRTVLAPDPGAAILAAELGVEDADVRTARMRGLNLLHRYAGDWIDHDWEPPDAG